MRKPKTRIYGLPIHVDSRVDTKICIITDSKASHITMSQDIYDLLIIAAAKEEGFSSDWIDDQLTRPRDDLFRSLANQEFYIELKKRVMDLKRDMLFNKWLGE